MSNDKMLVTATMGELREMIKEVINETNNKDQQLQKQQDEFISIAQAVKLFNPEISKVTLHRWKKEGKVPAYRMGGRIYYKRSELLEAAQRVKKYDRNNITPAA